MISRKNRVPKIYRAVIIIIDILILSFSIYLAFFIRYHGHIPKRNFTSYKQIIPYIIIASLLFLNVFGFFSVFRKNVYEAIYSSFLLSVMLFLSTVSFTFFNRGFAFPRTVLILSFILQFLLLSLWRIFIWFIASKNVNHKKYIFIGNEYEEIKEPVEREINLEIVKCIKPNLKLIEDELILKRDSAYAIDGLILGTGIPKNEYLNLLKYCYDNDLEAFKVPDFIDMSMINCNLEQIGDSAIIKISDIKFSLEERIAKRIFDLACVILLMPIISILMLITSVVVKLTSKGSIFYVQERVTRGHRTFNMYKFRTMVENAERLTGPTLAKERDNRITKVGSLLRRTRLDEIPQFINVLKGDMSIVGPRPERPSFTKEYEMQIEEFKYRTFVKAGITGLAQIMGKYSTNPRDKVKYDIIYIKSYSIFLDVKIVLKTMKMFFNFTASAGVKLSGKNEELKLSGKNKDFT